VNDLVDSRRADLAILCKRFHVKRLDAFGSVVRGGFNPASSDLDFIVEFESLSAADYAEAYFAFKEGLESLFDRPIDLVSSSSVINPYFRESIDKAREQIYAA